MAQSHNPLTSEQAAIIKSTAPILLEHGLTITSKFYHDMIQENSPLKNVFSNTHQATGHQARALAGALYAYAANIDNLGALAPAVDLITQKHASLYVKAEHYQVVWDYLSKTMVAVLGDGMTPAVAEAWENAYWQLADLMIGVEKKSYDQAAEDGAEWKDWHPLKLDKKIKETDDVTSFYFKDPNGAKLPTYKPGQYISVRVDLPELGFKQPRQYSLSDAPGKDYLRISVKREQEGLDPKTNPKGGVSNILHDQYKEGDMIEVSHPWGDFFFDHQPQPNHCIHNGTNGNSTTSSAPLILLGAGIGITPLNSILATETASSSKRPITFLHVSHTSSLRPFTPHLSSLSSSDQYDVETIFFSSKPESHEVAGKHYHHSGRPNLDSPKVKATLEQRGLKDPRTQYYICGPGSFMHETQEALKKMGVPDENVHVEVFSVGGTYAVKET